MNTTIINSQGVEASSFARTLKESGLDWEPLSDKVAGMDTGIEMPHRKLLYRSDTKQALGIVGTDYSPSDPREFVKSQFLLAELLKAEVTRIGFIPDRARAFAFVKHEKINIPRADRKVGDPLQVYVYSSDGWDGGTPSRSRLYVERLTCSNGMASTELAADLWVSHTSGMGARYELRHKAFVAVLQATVETIRKQFTRLASIKMSPERMEAFLKKLIPGDSGRTVGRRGSILGLFGEKGTANDGVTRWDAFNAVTEYVTHHRTYRQTGNTSVETNRFLGVVETDTLRQSALNLLLN